MITGIGIDTIENTRVAEALSRHGERFAKRILSESELNQWRGRSQSPLFLASRWAVKEAVSKALGCGIGAHLGWHDILVRNNVEGRPEVCPTEKLNLALHKISAQRVLISITHTRHSSSAIAVILS